MTRLTNEFMNCFHFYLVSNGVKDEYDVVMVDRNVSPISAENDTHSSGPQSLKVCRESHDSIKCEYLICFDVFLRALNRK